MLVLGIESSCDDTSVAVVENGREILANITTHQDEYHRKFGGVVPEIAARKHLVHILPTLELSLEKAGIRVSDVDVIAVTHRPGLVGSLMVGLTVAKSLCLIYGKPLLGINHIEAHAFAACFAGLDYFEPHVALVVSGGHTSLLDCENGRVRVIGRTVDDAAGEAFDKVAKLMNLGYPGGPVIDKLAAEGDHACCVFPRPMLKHRSLDFSFSGLKTAVIYYLHKHPDTAPQDIAACFQDAVVDVLTQKTLAAARQFGKSTLSVSGGVASNSALRNTFRERCEQHGMKLFIPPPGLCTDNAAMVAGLAYHKWQAGRRSDLKLGVSSNFSD